MLGATQMRVDAGGDEESWEEILPIVIAGYKDIIARAQPLGVEIIIENHWGPTNHPDVMHKLLDAVPGWACSSTPTTGPPAPTPAPGRTMPSMPG